MVEQETAARPRRVGRGPARADKEIAGKSPTQIAFDRLRKDKVAVVCTVVVLLLVLVAIFAPLITQVRSTSTGTSATPTLPTPTDVLDFDGYPKVGPPFHPFTWDHPLGRRPADRLRQPRLPALRAADLADRRRVGDDRLHHHRRRRSA